MWGSIPVMTRRKDFAFVAYPRHCIAGFNSNIRPRWVRVSVASAVRSASRSASRVYWDHWIAPDNRTFPSYRHAFYATPRLYPG
jgi:hypothetical protein